MPGANAHAKTTGERATFCLAIMFTVYLITQLPTYVYNLIQHTAALTTATSAAQLFPQLVVLFLTCFGYFATTSPLLMLMNYCYRQYVKEILCCALDSQDGKKHPIQQLQIGHDGLPMLQPKPKVSPSNIKMFFGANNKSPSYMTTSEHDLSPLERSHTTFDYDLSNGLLLSKAVPLSCSTASFGKKKNQPWNYSQTHSRGLFAFMGPEPQTSHTRHVLEKKNVWILGQSTDSVN